MKLAYPGHKTKAFSGPKMRPVRKRCPVQDKCQGCSFINEPEGFGLKQKFAAQLSLLTEAKLLDGTKIFPVIKSPRSTEYRTTVKLAVGKSEVPGKKFAVGLYQPGTHSIVHIPTCPLHYQGIKNYLIHLCATLEESSLTPWNPELGLGDLRYIAAKCSHLTDELITVFVVTRPEVKAELIRIVKKVRTLGVKIAASFMNVNNDSGNNIFSQTPLVKLVGQERLRVPLCGLTLEAGPTSFTQVNPWQAAQAYRRIEQLAGKAAPHHTAWDLYCGIGQIGLMLARLGYRVLACEENPIAIEDAKVNRRRNNFNTEQIELICGRVEDNINVLCSSHLPNLTVINPSRRGVDVKIRENLVHNIRCNKESRLIYLSCNVTTLVRDLQHFREAGLRVRQIEAFDMFPQTDHLEWLALVTA